MSTAYLISLGGRPLLFLPTAITERKGHMAENLILPDERLLLSLTTVPNVSEEDDAKITFCHFVVTPSRGVICPSALVMPLMEKLKLNSKRNSDNQFCED